MPDYTQQLLERLEDVPGEMTNKISALYMANHRASLRNRTIEKINNARYGQLRRWILGIDIAGVVPNAPEHIRNDPYYVGLAVGRDPEIYAELSDDLQRNPIVVATAIENHAWDLEDFEATDFEVSEDRAIVLAAVRVRGRVLEEASDQLQRDREVVMAAVRNNGRALRYASDELRGDREVVMAAVQSQVASGFRFASAELKRDRGVIMAAVRTHGHVLKQLSAELQRDREVVMAAVQNDGRALRYASDNLQSDREVVMAAVSNDGRALEYASEELQIDDGILEVIGTRN